MALEAVAHELGDAAPALPLSLRPSGLAFFRLTSVTEGTDAGSRVATYLAQHMDETFECGEIAWSEQDGPARLQRHNRRFFDPAMLRSPEARRALQQIGCL